MKPTNQTQGRPGGAKVRRHTRHHVYTQKRKFERLSTYTLEELCQDNRLRGRGPGGR